ncbi:MAG: hypothetical protein Q8M51_04525 [Polaromonas sp.]|uniref:hypothetical protein n=1 Tax=Polaromonas sp. TaxID=1869339 RepID=UPI0027314443|nr:hypothetical protein [Polaromonas sp.]MDP1742587.1 hypothetical protein [Polaromonas sp.]MDP1955648.1 hypothetical protein [Polaromonas sp.]MDP3355110.1 hypothetical protein [Polaromonas sp.]MDP3752460.1 hypothetical protein [Polaromonas sp.]
MLQSTTLAALPKRALLMAGATAALALAAMAFSGGAQARSDVSFSVGVGLPGVHVGVSNAYPVYQPVYQQPVYVQPAPVYYQPQPVYVQPAPVYYGRPHGWHKRHGHHGRDDDNRHGGYRSNGHYVQSHGPQPYVHGPQGFKPQGYYYGH